MISPELLRRYPFFSGLDDGQLRAIAMITDEVDFEKGVTVFEEGGTADFLYLLLDGVIELYFKTEEEFRPQSRKEFFVGAINPGEVFSISALIEPHQLSATARTGKESRALKIEGAALRELFEQDCRMGYRLVCQLTKAAMERLYFARVQLAVAQE